MNQRARRRGLQGKVPIRELEGGALKENDQSEESEEKRIARERTNQRARRSLYGKGRERERKVEYDFFSSFPPLPPPPPPPPQERVPQLWRDSPSPLLVVHVGVSGMANAITLERCGHNAGYMKLVAPSVSLIGPFISIP